MIAYDVAAAFLSCDSHGERLGLWLSCCWGTDHGLWSCLPWFSTAPWQSMAEDPGLMAWEGASISPFFLLPPVS